MKTPGYVYALINPSLPRLVKVGMTSRDPDDRVRELSSATGVATPFVLVYKEYFSDCSEAESYVHTILERRGVRVAANREFFEGEISDIINAIASAPGKATPGSFEANAVEDDLLVPFKGDDLDEFSLTDYKPKNPDEEIYEEAEAYYYGYDDTLQDYDEALRLYRQAAKLGSADAYHMIGRMHEDGEGVREDPVKAIEFYKEAARRGNFCSFGRMAGIFRSTDHHENERKAWNRFFEGLVKQKTPDSKSDSPGILACSFLAAFVKKPGLLSSVRVVLGPKEQPYEGAIRLVKDQAMSFAEYGAGQSAEQYGEGSALAKSHKAVLAYLQGL